MELFRTVIQCPAALQLAGDCGQNLDRCLPFLCSGKDCTDTDCIQDFTRWDEIVLHYTSAIRNAHFYCDVHLVCLQPHFLEVKHLVEESKTLVWEVGDNCGLKKAS